MLRVAASRFSSFCSTQPSWRPNLAASTFVSRNPIIGGEYFHLPCKGLSLPLYSSFFPFSNITRITDVLGLNYRNPSG